ncbi:MAG TPA: type IV toxin-antitoxin system AbiEi family antitoxin [Longimicrobium sp.]|jgi:predicted transcriptional regulator of viral defense system
MDRLPDYLDALQSRGRYTVTKEEIVGATGQLPRTAEAALRRLKEKRRVASPRRGFYVIVPAEYREAGAPPPSWFVHDLMSFLEQPYYVGLLSAAELHGAAHQRPQELQVVTNRPTRPVQAGRGRIRFVKKERVLSTPVQLMNTGAGSIRVSTPEATALDLVRYARVSGYLDNVATVLRELAEGIDARLLAEAAYPGESATAQRLGYLLERLGSGDKAERLARAVASHRPSPVPLRPDIPERRGAIDSRWQVIINEEVEPDE